MIRVLVVEDSAVARELLVHLLNSDPDIEVAGTASDGEAALEAVVKTRPDVITMDIHMPRMNGFDSTRRIMETRPTPIVIVSGAPNINEQMMAFRAIEVGALAVLPRPADISDPRFAQTAAEFLTTVKLMSEVKVIRRWPSRTNIPVIRAEEFRERTPAGLAVVAIGGSTGAPAALHCILSQLPSSFPAPILVVQHISRGFAEGLAEWMGRAGALPVRLATHGETMLPGHVYIAPDDHHLSVSMGKQLILSAEKPENGMRPSVAVLFRSVSKVFGAHAAGVLLSGMGVDGSVELKSMRDQGALTIAQDKTSSVVHGMPGEAIRLGGATYALPPERIAAALVTNAEGFAALSPGLAE